MKTSLGLFAGFLIFCGCQSKPGEPSGGTKTIRPEPSPVDCEISLKGLTHREVAKAAFFMKKKCQISEPQLIEYSLE